MLIVRIVIEVTRTLITMIRICTMTMHVVKYLNWEMFTLSSHFIYMYQELSRVYIDLIGILC